MLKDAIVDKAAGCVADEDVDALLYGLLFELALVMAHEHRGYGTFAAVYGGVVVIPPVACPEAFDDGEAETYRKIQGHRRLEMGAGVRNA